MTTLRYQPWTSRDRQIGRHIRVTRWDGRFLHDAGITIRLGRHRLHLKLTWGKRHDHCGALGDALKTQTEEDDGGGGNR